MLTKIEEIYIDVFGSEQEKHELRKKAVRDSKFKCKCGNKIKCPRCNVKIGLRQILDSYDPNCSSPPKKATHCEHQLPNYCE